MRSVETRGEDGGAASPGAGYCRSELRGSIGDERYSATEWGRLCRGPSFGRGENGSHKRRWPRAASGERSQILTTALSTRRGPRRTAASCEVPGVG